MVLVCICFTFIISGCTNQTIESIGEPPIKMRSITLKDPNLDTSYHLSIPEDWIAGMSGSHHIAAGFSDMTIDLANFKSYLHITNYLDSAQSEEGQQAYQGLFQGKYDEFETWMNKQFRIGDFLLPFDYQKEYSDFHYKIYQGSHGKIMEVKCQETYKDQSQESISHVLYYYREDIPYVVSVILDTSYVFSQPSAIHEFTSEEVALWVADSLTIEEL